MTEPAYVTETLAWCNKQRAQQGKRPLKKLPRGNRLDARSCPCGKATELYVNEDSAYRVVVDRVDFENEITLPRAVRRFVAAFDARRLPQYEARK